jgi:hypothetical protein
VRAITRADTRKVTTFSANTDRGPAEPTRAPPTRGPTTSDALTAVAIAPLAQGRRSAGTRFGTAALAAARKGALAAVANSAVATRARGLSTSSTASHPMAPPTSASTITRRRSNRSLRRPEIGPTTPTIPAQATNAADTQAAESVRSKTV